MARPDARVSGVKGRLVLLRHGQTDYNKKRLMTGIADVPLNDVGIAQAAEAGRRFAHIRFDTVYSSTLSRAFNTAALSLKAAGTQEHLKDAAGVYRIMQSRAIVEIDVGDFSGRCHKTDPEIRAWVRDFDKPMPNGESDAMALARVQRFFNDEILPRLKNGETVLVVAHAGIVRTFDYVLGLAAIPAEGVAMGSSKRRSVPNATPVVFDFIDGRVVSEMRLDGAAVKGSHPRFTPPSPG
jgi:2,3-bisphosphoglycerate-dependent phosphoglycerate mutase